MQTTTTARTIRTDGLEGVPRDVVEKAVADILKRGGTHLPVLYLVIDVPPVVPGDVDLRTIQLNDGPTPVIEDQQALANSAWVAVAQQVALPILLAPDVANTIPAKPLPATTDDPIARALAALCMDAEGATPTTYMSKEACAFRVVFDRATDGDVRLPTLALVPGTFITAYLQLLRIEFDKEAHIFTMYDADIAHLDSLDDDTRVSVIRHANNINGLMPWRAPDARLDVRKILPVSCRTRALEAMRGAMHVKDAWKVLLQRVWSNQMLVPGVPPTYVAELRAVQRIVLEAKEKAGPEATVDAALDAHATEEDRARARAFDAELRRVAIEICDVWKREQPDFACADMTAAPVIIPMDTHLGEPWFDMIELHLTRTAQSAATPEPTHCGMDFKVGELTLTLSRDAYDNLLRGKK